VIGKDKRKNKLVVSNDPRRLLTKRFEVHRVNWINQGTKFPLRAKVQVRYHSEKISAILKKGKSGKYIVELKKPVRATTAGQSAVFYGNSEVLGGGVII
jgi:tRNA U34 2-thiouridine synthase MnmA/TrmU